MKTSENSRKLSKQTILLFIILAAVGVAVMLAMLYFSVTSGVNDAQKTLDRNINDLKKQCNDYNDFVAADEVKSLVHLTEQAENLGEILALLSEDEKVKYLNEFCDTQRLDCVLILDENLMPNGLIASGRDDYEEWKELISETAVASVLSNPKKIYSVRTNHNGKIYDIAAAARQDAKGIVFCAVLQDDEKLATHYSSVRNLLASNETALSGTLYIAEEDEVIASNCETGYTSVSDIPEVEALNKKKKGGSLTRFSCNGSFYYGGSAKYRNYSLYAFYPVNEIFADCFNTMLLTLFLYVIVVVAVIAFHFKNRAYHNQELNRQYDIIRSVSYIYLLTIVVNIKDARYTILKYPKKWGEINTSGIADNAFFKKLLSYVSEEFRESYLAFMNPETIQERLADSEYLEYEYQDVSGAWLNDKIIPQERNENGKFHSYILARTSISKQKKAELECQERLKAAVQNEVLANQSKTDFLRRMSHDIRTPINVILGMVEIAEHDPTNMELQQNCREKSKTALEYLLELVNDILTINKADSADIEGDESTPFDLAVEVNKLYLVASERAKAYEVTLEKPTLSVEGKPLVGNALYLRQIMSNIIANAVRYSHKGGIVRFSVSQTPSSKAENLAEVRFVCEDNGVGMSKEFQKRMFEPFAQEGNADVSRFGGVGLGLSIVQKFVKKFGGTIRVDSEKNVGTRFEIVIPYKYSEKPVDDTVETNKAISLEGLTLLLVEDNELNMEVAEYMLSNAGANIIKAYNGKEAVACFVNSAFGTIDAIVTDMMMPVMDGLEETRCIRALNRPDAKTIPIIAMTANLFEQDKKDCKAAGMTGFIPKPLNIGLLLSTISEQVQRGEKNNG